MIAGASGAARHGVARSRLADEPRLVEIVELRFFAGLSVDETAEALGLGPRTVDRSWQRARAFLHRELREAGSQPRS